VFFGPGVAPAHHPVETLPSRRCGCRDVAPNRCRTGVAPAQRVFAGPPTGRSAVAPGPWRLYEPLVRLTHHDFRRLARPRCAGATGPRQISPAGPGNLTAFWSASRWRSDRSFGCHGENGRPRPRTTATTTATLKTTTTLRWRVGRAALPWKTAFGVPSLRLLRD